MKEIKKLDYDNAVSGISFEKKRNTHPLSEKEFYKKK